MSGAFQHGMLQSLADIGEDVGHAARTRSFVEVFMEYLKNLGTVTNPTEQRISFGRVVPITVYPIALHNAKEALRKAA